jgi:TolB protein
VIRRAAPLAALAAGFALACAAPMPAAKAQVSIPRQPGTGESKLANIRQLTTTGTQAEAYWSPDGSLITFQSTRDGHACDQQFTIRPDGSGLKRVSNGQGKTTCGWIFPGNKTLFFGSTHAAGAACPERPDYAKYGYTWGLDAFDIYTANIDGSNLKRLTNYGVYTTEAILSPDGKKIVFTSLKDGDLDIYTMNVDGSDVKRLTNTPGYDGGPWWSPDGKQIVYRAHHPSNAEELKDYQDLLKAKLVRPSKVELFVMNADGSNNRQVTRLGGANFGPSWTPDGKQIIFASNYKSPVGQAGQNFDLYLISPDGTGLTQITTDARFDGFPMFSPDGKKLIWSASRFAAEGSRDVNIFIADWRP